MVRATQPVALEQPLPGLDVRTPGSSDESATEVDPCSPSQPLPPAQPRPQSPHPSLFAVTAVMDVEPASSAHTSASFALPPVLRTDQCWVMGWMAQVAISPQPIPAASPQHTAAPSSTPAPTLHDDGGQFLVEGIKECDNHSIFADISCS
ncbi:uncharacterized protein LOC126419454 [Schistocerca serialis cubense]|uniref:uncharacterized protein LOC126419454 n=1 Tax=Schistocerca serialis cubense TaxID=2023355 RepID=UPI00214F4E70|nr:uncharacterized protein LOC126419454 [Schistocerca serialis cubense]